MSVSYLKMATYKTYIFIWYKKTSCFSWSNLLATNLKLLKNNCLKCYSGNSFWFHPFHFPTSTFLHSFHRPIWCLQTVMTFFCRQSPSGGRKWPFSSGGLWKPWNKRIKKVNLSCYFKIMTLFSQFRDYISQFRDYISQFRDYISQFR